MTTAISEGAREVWETSADSVCVCVCVCVCVYACVCVIVSEKVPLMVLCYILDSMHSNMIILYLKNHVLKVMLIKYWILQNLLTSN